jgi:penicillin-binding protein 2
VQIQHARVRARLSLLSFIVLGLFLALFSRLWYLQVLAGERYGDLAEGNRVRQIVLDAPRGRILDRAGRVLVRNRAAWAVTVNPSELGNQRAAVLGRLARVLGVPRARIEERLRDYTGSPLRGVPVAEDVPVAQLFYLTEHRDKFPGVATEVVALREYPAGAVAAHVLGYVGEISAAELASHRFPGVKEGDTVGKAGVELTYDRLLRGRPGVRDLEVDAKGDVVRTLDSREPVPGNDVRLSIDLDVQRAAERALAAGMQAARSLPDRQRGGTYPATAGTAVVLDPRDGSLLALASLPEYDPRKFSGGISRADFDRYAKNPGKPLIDRAVQSVYPPGSTWKAFTAMAALGAGIVTPSTLIDSTGSFEFGNTVKHDWKRGGHGPTDLAKSLRESVDDYYYAVGARFAAEERAAELRHEPAGEQMQATARSFGFGHRPALDLPYSVAGTVPDRAWRRRFWEANKKVYCEGTSALFRELCSSGYQWQGGDDLNIAIGQGDLQVSPLQLAVAYGALANSGTVWVPHVGRDVLDQATHRTVRTYHPRKASIVQRSQADFDAVRQGLEQVPTAGTATAAFQGFPLDRFPVAGKTGTADLPPKAPFAWFASYAPAADPRYVVVVMVEEGGHGGESAAPVARAIYEKLFGLTSAGPSTGTDLSG